MIRELPPVRCYEIAGDDRTRFLQVKVYTSPGNGLHQVALERHGEAGYSVRLDASEARDLARLVGTFEVGS